MEIGLQRGLAVDFQSQNRIDDLRYREQKLKQAEAASAAKAALFANDIQFVNSANSFDAPRVKQKTDEIIYSIGAYMRDHPDFEISPVHMAEINRMKNEIKSNPEAVRTLASDSARKQMLADLAEVAKNPEQYDTEAYQELQNQWANYERHGNQNGLEAAAKTGPAPFVYTKPKNFVNLPKALQEIGAGITNYDVKKGNNPGEWWTNPNEEAVKSAKQSALQEHKRQILVEAKRNGITDPKEIDKWVSSQIASGFKKHYSPGDYTSLYNRQIQWANLEEQKRHNKAMEGLTQDKIDKPKNQKSNYSAFQEMFNPKLPAGTAPPKAKEMAYGKNPQNIISGNDGTQVDLTNYPMNWDDKYMNINGNVALTGYKEVPIADAQKLGLYSDNAVFSDDITAPFIDSNFEVLEKTGKGGAKVKYLKVPTHIIVNKDDQNARVKFDIGVQGLKNTNMPTQTSPPNLQGAMEDAAGNVFDANGKFLFNKNQ